MKINYKIFSLLYFSTVIAIAIVLFQSWFILKENSLENSKKDINHTLNIIKENISEDLKKNDSVELSKKLDIIAKTISSRITLIDSEGNVLFDSDANPEKMLKHNDRPEIINAEKNNYGESYRFSTTLKKYHLYAAIKIDTPSQKFFLRISQNEDVIFKNIKKQFHSILLASILALILSAFFNYLAGNKIKQNLSEIKDSIANFAKLNFYGQIQNSGIYEIDEMSREINKMAEKLKFSIERMNQSNVELNTILTNMKEGVIATDKNGRVILANKTAIEIFNINESKLAQKPFHHEILRNSQIQDLIDKILETKEDIEKEIEIFEPCQKIIQFKGTYMVEEETKTEGILIVLSDFTQIKKLENIRKDFVANVSHEIKTPLTAILGAVETLLENDIKEKKRKKILKILAKHSQRLNNLITDILILSKIEQGTGKLELTPCSVSEIVDSAIDACKEKAEDQKIKINTDIEDFTFNVDKGLFEEALINLIDNAIKYSAEKKEITIKTKIKETTYEISVIDQGCGIPEKDIPRIFERFYRVDKARSRKLGGTGLGLAITKHIINAHNGDISVKSKINEGSTFTIKIPISKFSS